jgi:NTP pyrophosphatase (non-canonical NTP hydrolase)
MSTSQPQWHKNRPARTIEGIIAQCLADSERWFPDTSKDLPFQTLALAGEVGELANLVKKTVRGTNAYEAEKEHMKEEAIDVLIYLCNILGLLNVDVVEAYNAKREFNSIRFGGSTPSS